MRFVDCTEDNAIIHQPFEGLPKSHDRVSHKQPRARVRTSSLDRFRISSNSLYDGTDVHALTTVRLTHHELYNAARDGLEV